ncbi:MAG: arsenic transporter [Lachnospiraceae bacterium]|nr:arsenic transporter [Lachnospiraceae bacterium]
MKIFALILFILMYVVMIAKQQYRNHAAFAIAVIYILTGILPLGKILSSINWNVLFMLSGTMILVDYFIASRMPNALADFLLDHSKNVMMVTIFMSLFSGIISAFIDNVATVLMVAPVGLAICKKLNISPVPMVLSIAVSSNLQGAATLVGDTTSILLGDYAKMDFLSFFFMHGKPGIFFAVELGAMATIPIMVFLFRKDRDPIDVKERTEVTNYVPTIFLIAMVVALIVASFIPNKPDITNGIICLTLAFIMMGLDYLRAYFKEKRTGKDARTHIPTALKNVDMETLALLGCLFIVIAGITEVGIVSDFADFIVRVGGNNLFVLYTVIVWGSVFISAFVDNIPYVATMLPVLSAVTGTLGIEPYLLYFGLLSGATLGGNLTPFGASANIAGAGLLRKHGYEVTFRDFARIGIPFTLTAVIVAYIFLWLVWT